MLIVALRARLNEWGTFQTAAQSSDREQQPNSHYRTKEGLRERKKDIFI
jgi:hypothetical protein